MRMHSYRQQHNQRLWVRTRLIQPSVDCHSTTRFIKSPFDQETVHISTAGNSLCLHSELIGYLAASHSQVIRAVDVFQYLKDDFVWQTGTIFERDSQPVPGCTQQIRWHRSTSLVFSCSIYVVSRHLVNMLAVSPTDIDQCDYSPSAARCRMLQIVCPISVRVCEWVHCISITSRRIG